MAKVTDHQSKEQTKKRNPKWKPPLSRLPQIRVNFLLDGRYLLWAEKYPMMQKRSRKKLAPSIRVAWKKNTKVPEQIPLLGTEGCDSPCKQHQRILCCAEPNRGWQWRRHCRRDKQVDSSYSVEHLRLESGAQKWRAGQQNKEITMKIFRRNTRNFFRVLQLTLTRTNDDDIMARKSMILATKLHYKRGLKSDFHGGKSTVFFTCVLKQNSRVNFYLTTRLLSDVAGIPRKLPEVETSHEAFRSRFRAKNIHWEKNLKTN